MLLTTAKVTSLATADAVVVGYTMRWLIEELHRTWKKGWMNVEKTQLRPRNFHLEVGYASPRGGLARAPSFQARPDRAKPARYERIFRALNRCDSPGREGEVVSLADVVLSLVLAELDGYDRYSRKPAGPTVIGRGLERIAFLAEGLEILCLSKE